MTIHRDERRISSTLVASIAGLAALAAVVLLIYVLASVGDSSDASPAGDVYVSMGDSVAAGNGASDAATTSFAALLAASEGLTLFNVAKAGATSRVVIDEQLAEVLPLLRSSRVRFITVSAGGNDLAALIPNAACTEDPLPDACPLAEALDGVSERIDELLRLLRDAGPSVPVVLLGYPNFFSGTGHAWEAPAGRVLPELVDRLQTIALAYDRVAVALPSFDGRGDELTHVNDAQFDPHPNDAGHQVIADAMIAALAETEE
jgi:lysophospholipase L1-like esterase